MCESPDWTEEVTQSRSAGGLQMVLANRETVTRMMILKKTTRFFKTYVWFWLRIWLSSSLFYFLWSFDQFHQIVKMSAISNYFSLSLWKHKIKCSLPVHREYCQEEVHFCSLPGKNNQKKGKKLISETRSDIS